LRLGVPIIDSCIWRWP